MAYVPADDRYDRMLHRRCGRSGLLLPAISLGRKSNLLQVAHPFWGGAGVRRCAFATMVLVPASI